MADKFKLGKDDFEGGFKTAPGGTYIAQITAKTAVKPSKSGDGNNLQVAAKITKGPHRGTTFFDVIAPHVGWKIAQIITACGLDMTEGTLQKLCKKITGQKLRVILRETEYNGRPKNEVVQWLPLEGGPTTSGDDEEEWDEEDDEWEEDEDWDEDEEEEGEDDDDDEEEDEDEDEDEDEWEEEDEDEDEEDEEDDDEEEFDNETEWDDDWEEDEEDEEEEDDDEDDEEEDEEEGLPEWPLKTDPLKYLQKQAKKGNKGRHIDLAIQHVEADGGTWPPEEEEEEVEEKPKKKKSKKSKKSTKKSTKKPKKEKKEKKSKKRRKKS